MKRLVSLLVIMCMLIGCVSAFAEEAESGEEYYIDIELKYYTSDRLSPIFLPMKTNCPEITVEIYYPDGTLYTKRTYPGNFFENGLYSDYCSYYHYDGDYLLVFSYEDCRTEIVFTIENSDRYKAWFERTYGFKPEPKEPESIQSTNKGGSSVKVGVIEVSENEIELYTGDVKEITVVSSKSVTVEVEDESVVEANLSNGVLTVKALKMGESEIWLRNSDTYISVSATVIYGIDPSEKTGFYSDVTEDGAFYEAVEGLSSLGIMQGYEDNTFRTDSTLTRAEAAAIVVRLLKLDDEVEMGKTMFCDVPLEHWASGYINIAVANGIINGQGDGTFAPEETVTFEQMVKMLVCALGYEPVAAANGGWNNGGYIFAGSKCGLTKGIPGIHNENIKRGKVAQLAYRALDIEMMEPLSPPYGNLDGKTFGVEAKKTIRAEYWQTK